MISPVIYKLIFFELITINISNQSEQSESLKASIKFIPIVFIIELKISVKLALIDNVIYKIEEDLMCIEIIK